MFSAKDIFQTKAKAGGYTIAKSLRFRSSASAYLSRTPGSAGNRKTWTWSGWVKRGSNLGTLVSFWGTYVGTNNLSGVDFTAADTIEIFQYNAAYNFQLTTTQVFRDPSAWYHIVVAFDSTQATASDRIKLYVNGSQVTAFGTASYPSQNFDGHWNNSVQHDIGRRNASAFFDGYLSDVYFVDGTALTPTSFGQTDTATGVWMPKAYTGSYGTNGFYLNFSDASGATATTIGKDSSGNGNNWTPNNISVTAGVTYDSMVDTPTNYDNGGNGAGNYAVLNPLWKESAVTLSDANLSASVNSSSRVTAAYSNIAMPSGKWYCEITQTNTVGNIVGVFNSTYYGLGLGYPGSNSSGAAPSIGYSSTGDKYINGTSSAYGASWGNGDVIGIALDVDNGTITFYKNGVSQGVAANTGLTGYSYYFAAGNNAGSTITFAANFGQRPFTYTPPSGFKALCTQNLPTPTIGATSSTLANKYFDISTYSGTGASNSRTNLGFQPDLVWIKSRSATTSNKLTDAVRGVTKGLISDTTGAETTDTNGLTAFLSNGFTVGSDTNYNNSTGPATYVAWAWKANGAGSPGSGSGLTSITNSANTTAGFSITTYAGNGTAGASFNHGLGFAPKMVIIKRRGTTGNWVIWHTAFGTATNNDYIYFTWNAKTAGGALNMWNSTVPNNTAVTLGDAADVNASTANNTYVAYCFTPISGYSAFGSYVGNSSTDGVYINLGFRARFIAIKNLTDTGGDHWVIFDTTRDIYNVEKGYLVPSGTAAENTSTSVLDITSNGFKLRDSGLYWNSSTSTYAYMAFAETPANYSRAR